MGLRFDSPWFLLLLLPAAVFLIWTLRRNHRLSGFRKMAAVGTRMLIIILLICSLAGMEWFVSVERKAVVFVVDRSDSMSDQRVLSDWIKTAAEHKNEKDDIGVLSVGLNALIERNPSLRDLQSFELSTQVNPQFTNLASGLRLAESILSQDADSRIVLLSDGQENVGDMLHQAKLLRDKGIPVDVVSIDKLVAKDVAIEKLEIPEKLYQGEKFTLEVTLQSTYATEGELRIYEDNQEISNQQIQIERGENQYALQSLAKETGFHRYHAEIYVKEDIQTANNSSYSFSRVAGPPKVLVVEGQAGSSQNLTSILESSLIPYDLIPPEMLSREFSNYTAYESIIFNNVSATRLAAEQMEMIEQAVRDFGIGFMMLGGEDSFGLGGYFKTPIERTLPVYMDLRGKREIPSLGLVLVIDKSGSMSEGRIELAREAANRTVELMRDQDTVGVLAFDSTPWWVVEPQKLTNREQITKDISSIQASGGTEIYSAVEEGYNKLLDVEAQRKHIILLTDGMSATTQSYERLTSEMEAHNVTISAVGIGDGSDQQLLQHIANLGKGRYYFTNDQSTIPAIFSREAVLISRTYIVNQPFIPTLGQGGDWRSMFQKSLPAINAYIATTVKETAESVLMSPEPDPLLARWQYGAGKSVAWTSDLSGQWSGDWVNWESLPKTFTEIIKWTFPQFHNSPFQLSSRLEGDRVILEVNSSEPDFQGELKAVILDTSLSQREIELVPILPGEYQAEFNMDQPGAYLTRIDVYDSAGEKGKEGIPSNDTDSDSGQTMLGSVNTGFVIPYSPEYRVSTLLDNDKMLKLAELTGGRSLSLDNPEEVFKGEVQAKKKYYSMSYYLLIAALILWIIDIGIRRLSIPWEKLFRPFFHRLRQRESNSVGKSVTVERLRKRKLKVHGRFHTTDKMDDKNIPKKTQEDTFESISANKGDKNDRMTRLLKAKKRRR